MKEVAMLWIEPCNRTWRAKSTPNAFADKVEPWWNVVLIKSCWNWYMKSFHSTFNYFQQLHQADYGTNSSVEKIASEAIRVIEKNTRPLFFSNETKRYQTQLACFSRANKLLDLLAEKVDLFRFFKWKKNNKQLNTARCHETASGSMNRKNENRAVGRSIIRRHSNWNRTTIFWALLTLFEKSISLNDCKTRTGLKIVSRSHWQAKSLVFELQISTRCRMKTLNLLSFVSTNST